MRYWYAVWRARDVAEAELSEGHNCDLFWSISIGQAEQPFQSTYGELSRRINFKIEMLHLISKTLSAPRHLIACFLALTWGSLCFASDVGAIAEIEDVTVLAPYEVKGARMEDFGLRVSGNVTFGITIVPPGTNYVMVTQVFPNTAADKAGLRPGELISKVDGKSISLLMMIKLLTKLPKMQERKWAELEAGKKSVAFSLEVGAPGAKELRTVTMVIPSPGPHWGSGKWSTPAGRTPAVVPEAGPLATLAREVMNNGIWAVLENESFLGAASSRKAPILGYAWNIVLPSSKHRIWVTQQRGKTEIILECRSSKTNSSLFLTSPSGVMDKAHCLAPKKDGKRLEFSAEEVSAQFEAEISFWLTKVGRVTGRWPFEALSGETEVIAGSGEASSESTGMRAPLAESFLKLPMATPVEKALFFDALGKVGLDADCWAYTETSRSMEDDHLTTVRYDPSKPPDERSILLQVDGKIPKAAYLKEWHDEGHGALPSLGELAPLSSVVDVNDVRIFSDETTAVVFELPVKASNAEFPADKFQARFRVNKTHRGFEDFSVKLRESMRVAGVAKVTDAGFESRFQTLDPALAPQPVFLKMGGGLRVLFVKVSRAFEVTRTDFVRVKPFDETAVISK